MQVQFNSDSSVMGTENVAERIEAAVREKLARFESKLTRIEIHVRDENGAKHGADDKACMIEARISGCKPIGVTGKSDTVDGAARRACDRGPAPPRAATAPSSSAAPNAAPATRARLFFFGTRGCCSSSASTRGCCSSSAMLPFAAAASPGALLRPRISVWSPTEIEIRFREG